MLYFKEISDQGRTTQMAYQEWRDNDVAIALNLLHDTKPEMRGWEWQFIDRLCRQELLTQIGHTGSWYSLTILGE